MAAEDPAAAPFAEAAAVADVAPLPWAEWVWRAWHRLHQDRPWYGGGMGPSVPGRISWQDATAWADRHGYDPELLDDLLGAMDREFLDWHGRQGSK